jgi:hypothetical protein
MGHVACMREKINVYTVLMERDEGKIQLKGRR